MHFINMAFILLRACDSDITQECSNSFLALKDGRKNPIVVAIMNAQLSVCLYLLFKELRDMKKDISSYKESIVWNMNDLISPICFLIGYLYDDQVVACQITRVCYSIMSVSLFFMLLQQLRLTERFSFIVICIISSVSQLKDYVIFLFLMITFITVSYNCLGY